MNANNEHLIRDLQQKGVLTTRSVIEAFKAVDRKDFVPEALAGEAYNNIPLPIGYGQTISQPLTVAFMLEKLSAQTGDAVLDIGSGSGWQTALLAHIVGLGGHVYAIERIPDLCAMTQRNIAKYPFKNVQCFNGDGSEGLPAFAPYDTICAAAAAETLPRTWKEQVKIGGRIIAPVGRSIWQYDRLGEQGWHTTEFPGFAFVPLVTP